MYFKLGYIVIMPGQKGPAIVNRLLYMLHAYLPDIHADNNLHSTKS